MDEMKRQLKQTFACVFSFYLKSANFHWNVEGADFYQYHKMFEDIYNDTYSSIDPLAEHLRAIGTYTPATIGRIAELTTVEDVKQLPSAAEMISILHADNEKVIDCLNHSLAEAQKNNLQGLMNFLAGRIEQHNKWAWFLRASKKGTQ